MVKNLAGVLADKGFDSTQVHGLFADEIENTFLLVFSEDSGHINTESQLAMIQRHIDNCQLRSKRKTKSIVLTASESALYDHHRRLLTNPFTSPYVWLTIHLREDSMVTLRPALLMLPSHLYDTYSYVTRLSKELLPMIEKRQHCVFVLEWQQVPRKYKMILWPNYMFHFFMRTFGRRSR